MVLPTRENCVSENCVTKLNFTSIYAQFISMICWQNIETLRAILLHEKRSWRAFDPTLLPKAQDQHFISSLK